MTSKIIGGHGGEALVLHFIILQEAWRQETNQVQLRLRCLHLLQHESKVEQQYYSTENWEIIASHIDIQTKVTNQSCLYSDIERIRGICRRFEEEHARKDCPLFAMCFCLFFLLAHQPRVNIVP